MSPDNQASPKIPNFQVQLQVQVRDTAVTGSYVRLGPRSNLHLYSYKSSLKKESGRFSGKTCLKKGIFRQHLSPHYFITAPSLIH